MRVKSSTSWLIKMSLCLCFPYSLFGNTQKVIVDSTFDDNQNDLEYYWCYYDDNCRVGKDDRPQSENPGTPSVINVQSTDNPRHAFGDTSDNYSVKSYRFATDVKDGNRFAMMPFTFGSTWKTSWGDAVPYVGMTTGLARTGASIDLSIMAGLQFKVRSRQNNLNVRCIFQTSEIDSISNVPGAQLTGDEYGYYGVNFSTKAGVWSTITIFPDSLKLPGKWARNVELNLKKCTGFTWEISKLNNENVTIDTFDIDDVVIRSPIHCHQEFSSTAPLSPLPATGLFLNFESETISSIQHNLLWYGFADKKIYGEKLKITNGNSIDTTTGLFEIPVSETVNGSDTGHILKVSFNFETTDSSNLNYPVAGLEINMYDSVRNNYWNAAASGKPTIYFHYKTDEQVSTLIFEAYDDYDVTTPVAQSTRIERDGDIARWRCKLTGSNGEWEAVEIPLDLLYFCYNWEDGDPEPLHLSKIAKFRWQAMSAGGTGSFSIDNIYFPGATFSRIGTVAPSVTSARSQLLKDLIVSYQNGSIKISGFKGEMFSNATYTIYNSRGQNLLHGKINGKSTIPARSLSAGLYIISISGFVNQKKQKADIPLLIANE